MEDQTLKPQEMNYATDEMGFGSRFINIFANPLKTFESLNRRSTWLVPVLILILLSFVIGLAVYPIAIKSQMEIFRNNPNISAEQFEVIRQQIEGGGQAQKIIGLSLQAVGMFLVYYLLFAGVFYFTGSVILGGDSSYKKVLSVWAWSSLIGIASIIVRVPLIFIKEDIRVSLSPALLLSGDAIDTTLYTVLSQLDFFTIWMMAVFAYGFVTIYRFSVSKGYIAIGVLWSIWIALMTISAPFLKNLGIM